MRSSSRNSVTCLGDADTIFARLYAQLRELGWVGAHTVVVVVGDGAEWIWNRATRFVRRCEILDFWHALEHAWAFAQLRYGEGSAQADVWVHAIGGSACGQSATDHWPIKTPAAQNPELRESLLLQRECRACAMTSSAGTPSAAVE